MMSNEIATTGTLDAELDKLLSGDSVLKDNTFGWLEDDGTILERLVRLVNLLPVAGDIVSEARDTIQRLNDELDDAIRYINYLEGRVYDGGEE